MRLGIAKLTTTRSLERTESSGVLEHDSDSRYGTILYVIDIPLPPSVGEAVEKTIVRTLQQEYFEVDRRQAVYQFEDCLKQINAALAELAEEGKNDWVGHIHAVIALWADNELYITHTGRVLGAVKRAHSFVPIFDATAPERRILLHKTFANLTSGQLAEGDTVIIGNGEVGRHFSPQFLSQSLEEAPGEALNALFQAARRLHLTNIETIIARVEDDEETDTKIEVQTLLLDREHSEATAPKYHYAESTQSRLSRLPWQKWLQGLNQMAIDGLSALYQNGQKAFRFVVTSLKSAQKPHVKFEEPATTDAPTTLAAPALQRTPGQKVTSGLSRLWRTIDKTGQNIRKTIKKVPPRSLLVLSIILIGVVALTAWSKSRHHPGALITGTESQQNLDKIDALLKQATASKNRPEDARALLGQAKTLLDKLGTQQASTERQAYAKLISDINQITTIEQTSSALVNANTAFLAVVGQYLFTVTKNSGVVSRQIFGRTDAPETIYTVEKGATITNFELLETTRQIVIVTNANTVNMLSIDNTVQSQLLSPPAGESWPKIQSITFYQKNMYILESGTGAIWKYTSTDNQHFLSKQPYLPKGSVLDGDAVMLATDGYMYALSSHSRVVKLLKGNQQVFGPVRLPEPDVGLDGVSRITTDDASTSLYLQDKNRLVELSKDGRYVRQYVLQSGQISASFISPRSKRAWLLVGDKLIETSL